MIHEFRLVLSSGGRRPISLSLGRVASIRAERGGAGQTLPRIAIALRFMKCHEVFGRVLVVTELPNPAEIAGP